MSFLDLFIRNNKLEKDVPDINVGNKVRFLSLFSGIGAFEKALDNIGVEYELVGFSEIDKYAVKSYCAVHGVDESMNLGDITKISEADLPKNIDLITYGFPCQDISLAGKQKGMFNEDGTQTRSGLFFEALRIIEATKPRIAIAENVKNLTGKTFKKQFETVLKSLEDAGYNNYWKVLNAKDYGIPQNRERVFIISIRKDIDDGKFVFPEPVQLELRLKDMLEDEVDESFYLSDERIANVIEHKRRNEEKGNGFGAVFKTENDIMGSILTNPDKSKNYLLVREATKKGYAEAEEGDSINLEQPNSKTRRGRVGRQVAQTLTTSPQQVAVTSDMNIRKYTPRECWRLMGFDDCDFDKAEQNNSNNQLYKQAGNSIVVNVLDALFINLEPYLK